MLMNIGTIPVSIVTKTTAAIVLSLLSSASVGDESIAEDSNIQVIDYEDDNVPYVNREILSNDKLKLIDRDYIESVVDDVYEEIESEKRLELIESRRLEIEVRLKEEKKHEEEVTKIAKDIIEGNLGNGLDRVSKVEDMGYNYEEVKLIVEELSPKPVVTASSKSTPGPAGQPSLSSQVIPAFPHNTFKSYMRWTILSKSSPQGKLAAKATADPSTAIMKYNGRYLVALGFAYAGDIGEHIDIVMESGQVIPAIVGDWKAKEHTDANNSSSLNNGSIIEFLVSSNEEANIAVNKSGNYNTIFEGKVKEFRK